MRSGRRHQDAHSTPCMLSIVKPIDVSPEASLQSFWLSKGDFFGICVAGYPEAHPDTIVDDPVQMEKNYWENIAYLKQKVWVG